jgi:hypothetical protein
VVKGEGQGRGNSGVFLMQRYEVQVLDSYQNQTYYHGQAGAIYKQYVVFGIRREQKRVHALWLLVTAYRIRRGSQYCQRRELGSRQ